MNAVNELIILYNKLENDDFYKNAVHQILKNIEDVPKLSTYDLAEKCYVSPTTIRRISTRLGYDSYSDFKMSVGMDLTEVQSNILFSYSEMEWQDGFIEKGVDYAIDTLMEIKCSVSDGMIMKAAQSLRRAEHVGFFMSVDTSLLRNLQMRLLLSGKDVTIAKSMEERHAYVDSLQPNTVILFVEMVARERAGDIDAYKKAKEKGASYIHITDRKEAVMVDDTDIHIGYKGSSFRRDFYGTETILACLSIAYSNCK